MEFRLRDYCYPISIYRFRRFLEKTQWMSPDELHDWRLEKLRAVIKHAYDNVPLYQRKFNAQGVHPDDIREFDDISRLPFLSKDEVRSNFDLLTAQSAARYRPVLSKTSGSTGTPLQFYNDQSSSILEFAMLWRHWNWGGYRFGNRFCDLKAHIVKSKRGWEFDPRLNNIYLSAFHLSDDYMARYVKILKLLRPKILRGFPYSIDIFARWLLERGESAVEFKSVITNAETLFPHQRKNIEKAFRCKVLDAYGQIERTSYIFQCAHSTYHVMLEGGLLEIIDENGNEVGEGECGEIVGTSFHNMAMPFIRYRTRDLCVKRSKECPCGRNTPTVENIVGRVEDIIITPEGNQVGYMDGAFFEVKGIRFAQIVQEQIDLIRVKLVRDPDFDESELEGLTVQLRKRLGPSMIIDYQFVEDVERTQRGKAKTVISKISPNIDHPV
ncbi:MAG: hypothetical protein ABIA59_00415 [Candidatus Latescibacterota bacterium]